MKNLLTAIVLMTSITAAFGQDPIVDYIDVKQLCEDLEVKSLLSKTKDQTSCNEFKATTAKINHSYDVVVNRVDPDQKEVEQIQTQMTESQLVKICEELNSNAFANGEQKSLTMDIKADSAIKQKRTWKISFTFGPFLSFHKDMKMRLQNGDTDVVIDGIEPVQRTSLHHYVVWSGRTKPGQFIDEPQNDFTVEMTNDKMFIGLRYSHPKTLFQDRHDNPQINHNVDIKGTIGGVEVDETGVDLKNYIHTLTTSHGNTNINVFGGGIVNLAGKSGENNLELRLGVGAGISFANGVSKYWAVDEDGNRSLKITEHNGMKVYGYNLTGESSLRYNFMQGKMNASINGRGVYTRIDGTLGDLHTTGNLYSGQVGVALGYSPNLIQTKKEKTRRKIAAMKKRDEKLDKLETKREELRSNK